MPLNQSLFPPVVDFSTPVMRQTMDVLLRAAKTPASILITGESGTGKGVLVKIVHQHSHLADKPLVTVSCPSLSHELLESDLFGHVRGAFTGAVRDHWGKVKAAAGGTLFLDEIGDLPLEIQPKLLRLLQEREYERVGENVTRPARVRIISATASDLKKKVQDGKFREDLYFRLNVICVQTPPLRERPDDLLHLTDYYFKQFTAEAGRQLRGFSREAMNCIRAYRWPGNLRELRNAVERGVIMASDDWILPEDLPAELRNEPRFSAGSESPAIGSPISMDTLVEMHLRKVLEHTPSLSEAARILGVNRTTLYRMRKKMGLS